MPDGSTFLPPKTLSPALLALLSEGAQLCQSFPPSSSSFSQYLSREAPNSLLRCSSFCRNFRSRSEGMAKEMPDVTFIVFTPITSPSCRGKDSLLSSLHCWGEEGNYCASLESRLCAHPFPACCFCCLPNPAEAGWGLVPRGLHPTQPLPLPCQHQPSRPHQSPISSASLKQTLHRAPTLGQSPAPPHKEPGARTIPPSRHQAPGGTD